MREELLRQRAIYEKWSESDSANVREHARLMIEHINNLLEVTPESAAQVEPGESESQGEECENCHGTKRHYYDATGEMGDCPYCGESAAQVEPGPALQESAAQVEPGAALEESAEAWRIEEKPGSSLKVLATGPVIEPGESPAATVEPGAVCQHVAICGGIALNCGPTDCPDFQEATSEQGAEDVQGGKPLSQEAKETARLILLAFETPTSCPEFLRDRVANALSVIHDRLLKLEGHAL